MRQAVRQAHRQERRQASTQSGKPVSDRQDRQFVADRGKQARRRKALAGRQEARAVKQRLLAWMTNQGHCTGGLKTWLAANAGLGWLTVGCTGSLGMLSLGL